MSETIKKAAAKAKEGADALSAAVATARTRTGEPKVIKAPPKEKKVEEPVSEPVDVGKRLDAFIAHEKGLLAAIDIPDDTGDAMYNAVEGVLYYKERITKAELAKKYLAEG